MPSPEVILSEFIALRSKDREKAFAFLLERYGDSLYGVVSKVIADKHLIDDALQEGFVKIWKNLDDFDPQRSSLFTWMFTIVRNSSIDLIRREGKRKIQSLDSDVSGSVQLMESSKITDTGLMKEIHKMDPKYRELIEMIYFKAYTQQEVSDELNIPLGTVKTRIQTAIKILRNVLSAVIILLIMLIK